MLAVLAFLARPAAADDVVTIALPQALRPGETAFVQVTVGVIVRGQEVEVTTADGRPIGTVSPFGIRSGGEAGTYTMPVPADEIRDGRLSLRLLITQSNGPPRPPTVDEVKGVTLSVVGTRP
ncbi:hypothetical protein EJ913_01965 [Azospirillum doebereinerae]|uniref:Carboxypeptidase regulatory-like domain-containing protein n=2 Tax=Azospirillum doebereinerae TaxID=92933 RepID=A0A433JG54_9PROT|nr:hypothetical protein EJ913_01965 [Azospirillum doebereinerae]